MRGLGFGGGEGENGLRPSRAAAWISNLDACEGSIIQFVWDFEYVGFERKLANRMLSDGTLKLEKFSH